MKTNKLRVSMLVLLALCAVCWPSAPALAQQKIATNKNNTNKQPPRKKTQAEIDMQNYFHHIDKPMSLPDVPDVNGHAKFKFGLERTDSSGLTRVGLRYSTKSSEKEVIDYYKQGLIGQQWKLSSVSANGVSAEKGDRSVKISIQPRSSSDAATDFMVNYYYKNR